MHLLVCVPLEIFVRQAQRARIIRIRIFMHMRIMFVEINSLRLFLTRTIFNKCQFQHFLHITYTNIISHCECIQFTQNQKFNHGSIVLTQSITFEVSLFQGNLKQFRTKLRTLITQFLPLLSKMKII